MKNTNKKCFNRFFMFNPSSLSFQSSLSFSFYLNFISRHVRKCMKGLKHLIVALNGDLKPKEFSISHLVLVLPQINGILRL